MNKSILNLNKWVLFAILTFFFFMEVNVHAAVAPETDFQFDPRTGTITKYNGLGGDVEIPNKINDISVTFIGSNAFDSCQSLTSVIIPDGVTSIGDRAFQKCPNLTSVIIPNSVTSIGEASFANTALQYVTIPKGVNFVGRSAFYNCNLTSVVITSSIVCFGQNVFKKWDANNKKSIFSESLIDIYFSGTIDQWRGINNNSDPDSFSIKEYQWSDGTPLTSKQITEKDLDAVATNGITTVHFTNVTAPTPETTLETTLEFTPEIPTEPAPENRIVMMHPMFSLRIQ